jgi:small subunit ribosomal protein S9
MSPGKGNIIINGVNVKDYIPRESLVTVIKQPLVAVEQETGFNVNVNVNVNANVDTATLVEAVNSKFLNEEYRFRNWQTDILT